MGFPLPPFSGRSDAYDLRSWSRKNGYAVEMVREREGEMKPKKPRELGLNTAEYTRKWTNRNERTAWAAPHPANRRPGIWLRTLPDFLP